MTPIENAYVNAGGFDLTPVFSIFTALIAIWMFFVLGTVAYEYATGRTKEFPVGMTLIRVGVVLSIAALVSTWIRA